MHTSEICVQVVCEALSSSIQCFLFSEISQKTKIKIDPGGTEIFLVVKKKIARIIQRVFLYQMQILIIFKINFKVSKKSKLTRDGRQTVNQVSARKDS